MIHSMVSAERFYLLFFFFFWRANGHVNGFYWEWYLSISVVADLLADVDVPVSIISRVGLFPRH